MEGGYGSASEVPEPLDAVVLDAGDTGFAVYSGMSVCLAGYLAARTAQSAAKATDGSAEDAEHAERRWQASWLAEGLELTAG